MRQLFVAVYIKKHMRHTAFFKRVCKITAVLPQEIAVRGNKKAWRQ